MQNSIGGSIFVRNAIKYDYCIIEAVRSLLLFCDKVVVLECQSDDKTAQLLIDTFGDNPRVKLVINQKWDVAENYTRLAILANIAKSYLTTKWHFMLQADEVVHPDSIPFILRAVEGDMNCRVSRYNLWGDFYSYIPFDSPKKPCGDDIVRLAKLKYDAERDAESLQMDNSTIAYRDNIKIIHYGFLRNNHLDKIIDMQSWFFGTPSIDKEVLRQKETTNHFDSTKWYTKEELKKIPFSHPVFMNKWIEERTYNKNAVYIGDCEI